MRTLQLLCLFFVALISGAYSQPKDFPKPYELDSDTATIIRLPFANWQYLKENNKPLSLNEVLKLGDSFKNNVATFSKENTTDGSTLWLRFQIKNNLNYPLRITISGDVKQMETYIADSTGVWQKYLTGKNVPWSKKTGLKRINALLYTIPANAVITIYKRVENDSYGSAIANSIGIAENVIKTLYVENDKLSIDNLNNAALFGFLLFAAIINFFFFYTVRERVYLLYGILLLVIALLNIDTQLLQLFFNEYPNLLDHEQAAIGGVLFLTLLISLLFLQVAKNHPRWNKVLLSVMSVFFLLTMGRTFLPRDVVYSQLYGFAAIGFFGFTLLGIGVTIIIDLIAKRPAAKLLMIAVLPLLLALLGSAILQLFNTAGANNSLINLLTQATLLWPVIVLSWSLFGRFKAVLNENAMQAYENERLAREKEEERNQLIARQKEELEIQVTERTAELSTSLASLKETQAQLIQSEKMASLGELTAGIAHEIQNPLNFVNNFSEVNAELIDEMQEEIDKGDLEEAKAIANDIKENQLKISQHGKRADSIVKGMLQHSRVSNHVKEPTDINKLADEYLRLAYQGLRAKDKSFNAELVTNFADGLPAVNIVPQDIGRVLLNLYTNAFYATQQRQNAGKASYKPTLELSTRTAENGLEVIVKDNGTGIPDDIKDKILQPFFTTKPTGEGTGLGLSISYDIVVKGHGGKINIDTKPGDHTIFTIWLPVINN